jgi:hypothetical protein
MCPAKWVKQAFFRLIYVVLAEHEQAARGCRFEYEPAKWSEVRAAFAEHFPELLRQ